MATVVAVGLTAPVVRSSSATRPPSALPAIEVTLDKTLSVSARGVRAGWADLDVTGRAVVARFAHDYDIEAFNADYETAQSDAGRQGKEAFERLMDGTTFLGGIELGAAGSIKLPRPGTYTVMALNTVSGTKSATFEAGPRTQATRGRPPTQATIRAVDGAPWGGPASLPHEGSLLLTNSGSDLHNLVLQRVQEGTTAAEYSGWLYSNEAEPNFDLRGRIETGRLSPGRRMVVHYRLPRGQYAVMCFETNPRSGMAHVFQKEVRMIHLR
jgi:hypothetical protein